MVKFGSGPQDSSLDVSVYPTVEGHGQSVLAQRADENRHVLTERGASVSCQDLALVCNFTAKDDGVHCFRQVSGFRGG